MNREDTSPTHAPWHRFDLTLTDHYTDRIITARKQWAGDLRPAVAAYITKQRGTHTRPPRPADRQPHPDLVAKAHGSHGDPAHQAAARQEAAAVIAAAAAGDTGPLLDVLRDIYGDSYLAGARAALEAMIDAGASGAVIASGFGALAATVDWDEWKPGWAAAANELSGAAGGRGLDVLLANAGVRIRGIAGTELKRLAAILAEGLESGASVDTIADTVMAFVGSPVRAGMIANTETARAMSSGTRDTYQANGLTAWNWLATPEACPECADIEAENPHLMDEDMPPAHPDCRCAPGPELSYAEAVAES